MISWLMIPRDNPVYHVSNLFALLQPSTSRLFALKEKARRRITIYNV